MDSALIWEMVIKALVLILALLTGFAYLTYYERRGLARIQSRLGPNRAGPQGLLQPVADAVKLIFKEEFIPGQAYKVIFILAPIITVVPAILITATVPWGGTVTIGGHCRYKCRRSLYYVGGIHCRLRCSFGRLGE